jgi:hypothetical protein
MFSPGKVVIAGALAFAVGGALFIAKPVGQPGGVPAAQGDAVAPTWVTGTMEHVEDSCSETGSSGEGEVSRHSYECAFTWTSSDPRLTGDASKLWIEDSHQTDEGPMSVGMDASFVRNEGGDWACSYGYIVQGSTPDTVSLTDDHTITCIGSGGYEGLSAVLVSKPLADAFGDDFVGLIFSGDMPPLPEAPAAE